MIGALIAFSLLIVFAVWLYKWITKPDKQCDRCDTTSARLKSYPLFNVNLCDPCAEKVIQQQLTALYTEIRNRI